MLIEVQIQYLSRYKEVLYATCRYIELYVNN